MAWLILLAAVACLVLSIVLPVGTGVVLLLLLAALALLVSQAQRLFGDAGALATAALAALADAHSPIASLLSLFQAQRLDAQTLRQGVLVALAANTVTRLVTAFVSGGAAYALRVGPALLAGLAAAATAVAFAD